MNQDLLSKAALIKFLVMDCDGVLTDGRLYFSPGGEAMKTFHVRDGQGIANWHSAGFLSAVVTGREGSIVEARAAELGMFKVVAGPEPKDASVARLMREAQVTVEETAFIGDDIGDLPAFNVVGIRFAVADAAESIKAVADHCTLRKGGHGAVREIIDLLLSARGLT